ncbi:MAG: GGDEF domain-containing protein, partial [Lachnospiraceae bacterium]|nr:GGDEF domain-containing protein [Lachnospiraceae bacterium]
LKMDSIREGKINRFPGQLKRCRQFLREVKSSDDSYLLGFAYYYLADIYFQTGKPDHQYVDYVTRAIPLLKTSGDTELLIRCYNLLGINALNNGNHQLGLDFFLNAINFLKDERADLRAMLNYNIAQIYDSLGNKRLALSYVRDAKKLVKAAGIGDNLFMYMYCLCAEGAINLDLNREKAAIRCSYNMQKLMKKYPDFTAPSTNLFALSFGIRISHIIGDIKLRDLLLGNFFDILEKGEYQTDAISEITYVAYFLAKADMYDRLEHLIKLCEPVALSSDSSYIHLIHAENMLKYYKKIGRQDKYNEMLEVYYTASMQHKKESNEAYIYALSLRQKMDSIEAENLRLQKQAGTDALTNLSNRFRLNEEMDRIFARALDEGLNLCIEIIDVDYFKEYNDTYGHQAGDDCLRAIADVLKKTQEIAAAADDGRDVAVARYGGDEFVLIFLGYDDEELMGMAKDIRRGVFDLNLAHEKSKVSDRVSISQGLCNSTPGSTNRVWDYLYAADNALYAVKTKKRGQIELIHKAYISDSSFNDAEHS